jgi:hypothetical protein
MDNPVPNQSFGVEDIRRIRDVADVRRRHMTAKELARDIGKSAVGRL